MSSWIDSASSWLSGITGPRRVQLGSIAILSAFIATGTLLTYQSWQQDERTKYLKASIPRLPPNPISNKQTNIRTSPEPQASPGRQQKSPIPDTSKDDERSTRLAERARKGDYDEGLILEQLARNRVFLEDEGLSRVRSAFIIIVGCGGVGSHAAAALARSGVSRIRLIDFDQVTLSSLNRHSLATLADVGTPKVECIRRRLEQVTPWVKFDCRNELFSKKTANDQLGPYDGKTPDFIVDAIDNIDSKVDLLFHCHQNGLRVISSMGAGCKSDPTRILIGDISASIEDPLSRSTRRRLKLLGIPAGIPVVFSTEKSASGKAQLQPLSEEEFAKGDVRDLSVMQDFRVRILPVLGTMPAMFGLSVTNHILLELGQYPHEYLTSKYREKMYDAILAYVQGTEERLARWKGDDGRGLRIPLTVDDVGYLVEEIYRGRSVISGISTRIVLTRWRLDASGDPFVDTQLAGQKVTRLKMGDLVCMTKEEAAKHEKDVLKGDQTPENMYPPEVIKSVSERMREQAYYEQYR